MLRYLTILCFCLIAAIACDKSSKSGESSPSDSTSVPKEEASNLHSPCSGGSINIEIGVNCKRLTPEKALEIYSKYKEKILKREVVADSFCVAGSGSQYKILKCAHFPAGKIEDHICFRETSLKSIYSGYDGIRLYPVEKVAGSGDIKKVRFILTFTKRKIVNTEEIYNDLSKGPILLLELDWLKDRICSIGVHKEAVAMMAHRLCTPRCPENNDADLLFDY